MDSKYAKLRKVMGELKSYEKEIFKFEKKDDNWFVPANRDPKEDGYYLTIRCGLGGIYKTVNEWRDGYWSIETTDASFTVAFTRKPIVLKSFEIENADITFNITPHE